MSPNDSVNDVTKVLLRLAADAEARGSQVTPLDLGWLGRVFGARYAATNIAGVAVAAATLLLVLYWFVDGQHPASGQVVTGAFSLISLALGYLFGSSGPRV